MTRRLKLMTILGTRPDLIKTSRLLTELERRTDHVLVHTGQNHDPWLCDVFFEELGLPRPRHCLGAVGSNAAEAIAEIIVRSDRVLSQERPDALVLYGDTNSSLAVLAAKRRRIPVFHLEAGNRCFDERVPEEANRRVVDHLADVNLAHSERARQNLLREGLAPDRVLMVGSPLREVLEHYRPRIDGSGIRARLDLKPGGYFLASLHREENVDDPERLRRLLAALAALAAEHERPVLISTHPRTRRRLDALSGEPERLGLRFHRPFGFFDYVKLQEEAFCVLSDSGSLMEEAAILGLPAVTLREAHERPEGMDRGVVVMSGLEPERIAQAVEFVTAHHAEGRRPAPVPEYAGTDYARTVVRIVLGYVDYVSRTVWSEVRP
jgi:UDP-N-acetylglucosamine 2-epimerase (non-hydrolysing)